MASLPTRTTASFAAITPVPNLTVLDNEFNQYVGASGIFNGGTTATKLLVKSSDASDPPVEIDQVGAGPLAEWKQNGNLKASIDNDGDLTANGITSTAGVVTFGSIPLGPASNPTTDNQLTRKAYVDAKLTLISASFGVADPSTPTVGAVIPGTVAFVAPGAMTITEVTVSYQRGSHAAGTSVTFQLQKRTAASTWSAVTNFGDVTLDDTNDDAFKVYTNDIVNATLASKDTIIAFISARSGTVTELDVTINFIGFQVVQ